MIDSKRTKELYEEVEGKKIYVQTERIEKERYDAEALSSVLLGCVIFQFIIGETYSYFNLNVDLMSIVFTMCIAELVLGLVIIQVLSIKEEKRGYVIIPKD